MTLLFAGHDTTTATVTFLFRELAGAPEWADRAAGDADDLELCLDETLRLWPPAWVGPRRATVDYEFAGQTVPAGAFVNYSSWATHRLPDVWDAPAAFRPERFAPGARERIPKGAYIPFGGGSRTCIGMRFGQQEIRLMAARILREFRLDLPRDHRLEVRQTPTLGPVGGLPAAFAPPLERRPARRRRGRPLRGDARRVRALVGAWAACAGGRATRGGRRQPRPRGGRHHGVRASPTAGRRGSYHARNVGARGRAPWLLFSTPTSSRHRTCSTACSRRLPATARPCWPAPSSTSPRRRAARAGRAALRLAEGVDEPGDTLGHGHWAFAQTANCAVRREAFEAVGGFSERCGRAATRTCASAWRPRAGG